MVLPNFVIIGAMKAATSSLRGYLQEHPDVFVPEVDELHFFVEEHNWGQGLEWYRSQFAGAVDAKAVGEKSPTYTMYPVFRGVPERMTAVLGDVRIIYVVRHPVERMRSQYQHFLAVGKERRPIEQALRVDSDYFQYSCYATQLEQYLPFVDRDRMLVLTSDELRHDRLATVRRVLQFLQVDADWTPPNLHREAHRSAEKRVPSRLVPMIKRAPGYRRLAGAAPGRVKQAMARAASRPLDPDESQVPPELEASLAAALRPEVERLRPWLGPDFDGWGIA